MIANSAYDSSRSSNQRISESVNQAMLVPAPRSSQYLDESNRVNLCRGRGRGLRGMASSDKDGSIP